MPTTKHPQVTSALRALADAAPAYVEAEAFFDGKVDEIFFSDKLRRLFKDSGRHFRVNYARTPVDVLTERTTIQGVTCSNAAQKKILDAAWEDNELGIEAKDVHRRAYEFGDSYIIAWPADDEDRDIFPAGVEAYAHDPQSVRVFYDPMQPRRKVAAVHAWEEPGDELNGLPEGKVWHRVDLYFEDRIEPWVSVAPVVDSMGARRPITDDDAYENYIDDPDEPGWPWENPTPGIIPVFHFRTGRPYGRPEHADAYGPQNGINKLVTSLFGAVDHAILPQRYALEDDASKAAAGVPTVPSSALFEDEATSIQERTSSGATSSHDLGSEPGDVWLMRGTKAVGQFAGADPKTLIDPMLALVQAMADVTDMPANRYHRGGQAPAADSQRMDEAPLRAKTGDRHAQLGVTWHEFFSYICEVNGLGATDAQVAWAPPENYNDKASWEAAILQLDAGVPFEQVMLERGYADEVIQRWKGELPDGVPPSQAVPPEPVAPVVVAAEAVVGTPPEPPE